MALAAATVALMAGCGKKAGRNPIRVGVLHSLTGTMAISETPVKDATLMAIEEINAGGGLLGRLIEPVVVDGRSDGSAFAAEAERLITEQKVSVVFGCWTSASRRSVKPVFEKHSHLLVYPVQYEGLEQSPSIVYTGAAPNQQIIPAVKWCFEQGFRRFYLVASDYVFPRAANEIIRAQVKALRGQIVGEDYLLLGARDVAAAVARIAAAKPDIILNTINGDTNVVFFEALRRAGITPAQTPTLSFSIAEHELRSMKPQEMVGDYAAWNYFQSVDSKVNRDFVARFRARQGAEAVTDDPIEAGYFGVHLWAKAVQTAGTETTAAVRAALLDQSLDAPEGRVYVDSDTRHTWKTVRVGRIRPDGQFDIVWSSAKPVRPVPYPVYKSKAEWEQFLSDLYDGWGRQWANPGP
jgi:urea transport system substrate-binding protein